MNKNSKRNKVAQRKASKQSGFRASVYKKKSKPFPRPNSDEDVSLRTQSLIYYGLQSMHTKKN